MPTRNRAPKNPAYEAGLAVRRRVLGKAHVKRALENATSFDADFQEMVTRHAWGDIWTRPGLDLRTRSIITIAILAALGRSEELDLHVRATRNTGATPDDVKEVLMQVALYAGVPAANSAFRIAKAALAEIAKERIR
jgi:4-carboxymuconolactone decarboxylase